MSSAAATSEALAPAAGAGARATSRHDPAAAAATAAIGIHGVAVHYGKGQAALEGIDLSIAPGDFVALLGPSGCGKSTLLNVAAGFVAPTRGAVTVNGKIITEPGADRPVVFQQHSLFPWMSVLENVAFGPRMLKRLQPLETARRQLALVGLADYANHYPAQLSGGMQQRVGLARALAVEPPVLLMDEPFGALDAQTRLLMQEQLLRLWEARRQTVLFVTHDIDEAIFLADRVIVLGLKPNTVRGDVPVDLPRPRNVHVRRSEAYVQLYDHLFSLIRQESLKSFAMSDPRNPSQCSPL